jgi:predicted DNA-binding protein
MTDQDESIGAKVSEEFKQRVRLAAARKGMSMSEYIREAVETQLEEDEEAEGNSEPAAAVAD